MGLDMGEVSSQMFYALFWRCRTIPAHKQESRLGLTRDKGWIGHVCLSDFAHLHSKDESLSCQRRNDI